MKILNVIAQKPGNTGSGVYLNELVKRFALMGHEQAVIAGIAKEEKEEFKEYYQKLSSDLKEKNPEASCEISFYPILFGTPVLPFPVCGMSDEMPYESTRYCDMDEDMICQFQAAFCYQMDRVIEEFEPDLVICHHLYLLTATICDVFPDQHVIGICHNTDLRQLQKHDMKNDYIIGYMQRLEHIFVPQKAQYDQVLSLYKVKEERVSMLGMGYNEEIFTTDEGNAQDSSPAPVNAPIRMVFAGKIAEKKGLFSLFRALESLDPEKYPADSIVLTCAGGAGNEREADAIKKVASKSRFEINFPGRLSQEELACIYKESDIFVLPSYYEGIPLVAIEALACGCKVLITDLPGVKDWLSEVTDNACITYVELPPMKNVDEPVEYELPAFEERLAEGIEEMIAKPFTQADVSKLSWDGIASKLLSDLAKS